MTLAPHHCSLCAIAQWRNLRTCFCTSHLLLDLIDNITKNYHCMLDMEQEAWQSELETSFQRLEMVSRRRERMRHFREQWPILSRYVLEGDMLAFHIDLPPKVLSWSEQKEIHKHCRELICELRTNPSIERMKLGSKLLENLQEAEQHDLLLAITSNPALKEFTVGDSKPRWQGSTPCPAAIFHSFYRGCMRLCKLNLFDLKLSTRSDVISLSETIKGNSRLRELNLHVTSVGSGVASKADQKGGLLDSILHAMKEQLHASLLKLAIHSVDSELLQSRAILVSTKALRMLVQVGTFTRSNDQRELFLEGLHLTDSHCKCIANALLAFPHACTSLSLRRNPGVGEPGYQALLGLLNRNTSLQSLQVDDKNWNESFRLIIKMNQYGRDKAIDHGGFVSREKWIDWLARLSRSRDDFDAPLFWLSFEDVGAIWYTLLERPDFIYA